MKTPIFFSICCLIILTAPVWADTASIGKDKVNVRSAPDPKASVLFQAHLGYPVEIEKTQGEWVQIKDWQNKVGWVLASLVNKKVHTVVIQPNEVNIRKGPGLNYQAVGVAKCGEVYKVFSKKDGWVRIGYYMENQEIGWIREDMVWGE